MEYNKVQSASASWSKAKIKEEPIDMVDVVELSENNVKSTLNRMAKFGDKVYLPMSSKEDVDLGSKNELLNSDKTNIENEEDFVREHHKIEIFEDDHFEFHEGKTATECKTCKENFSEEIILRHHQYIHERNKHSICDFCGKSFKSKYYLSKHIEEFHEIYKSNICENCGEKFRSKYFLLKHTKNIKESSSGIKVCETKPKILNREKCKTCFKCFNSKYYLSKHIGEVHNQSMLNICRSCGKNFKNLYYLKKHDENMCKRTNKLFDEIKDSQSICKARRIIFEHGPDVQSPSEEILGL